MYTSRLETNIGEKAALLVGMHSNSQNFNWYINPSWKIKNNKKLFIVEFFLFSSRDEVQESLCCHPVVGVGVSTYKLIDYNSYTYLVTPFIFGTHMYALGQDLSMHTKILIPVTLTFTHESAFRFRNLRLGFEKSSQLLYLLRYTFYIWHTRALGQDLSMHAKILTPVTLTLTSVCF